MSSILELTAAEQTLMLQICQQHARQLLTEIDHTDNREYKTGLVENSNLVDVIIRKLEQATSAVSKP